MSVRDHIEQKTKAALGPLLSPEKIRYWEERIAKLAAKVQPYLDEMNQYNKFLGKEGTFLIAIGTLEDEKSNKMEEQSNGKGN